MTHENKLGERHNLHNASLSTMTMHIVLYTTHIIPRRWKNAKSDCFGT
jgi:hypothetical protein